MLQVLPDFLLQFPEEFGIGLAHCLGFADGGPPPKFPGGQAIPVILA